MKTRFLLLKTLLLHLQLSQAQGVGKWAWSTKGLPVYQYTGGLPARAVDKEGKNAMLPDDPYFLSMGAAEAIFLRQPRPTT